MNGNVLVGLKLGRPAEATGLLGILFHPRDGFAQLRRVSTGFRGAAFHEKRQPGSRGECGRGGIVDAGPAPVFLLLIRQPL